MLEIVAVVFLGVMAYYDLFHNENIPANIVHTFFLISLATWFFEIQSLENLLASSFAIGIFFLFHKLKLCGEAEAWIFGSLAFLFGNWIGLVIAVSYITFTLKHLGGMELKFLTFDEFKKELKKINKTSEAFIPFILIALLAVILAGISI